MISGRTKICDIDMLRTVATSSLFNNVMQTVNERLMTLLPLHWANITLHLDLVYVVILLMLLVLKRKLWFYTTIQGHTCISGWIFKKVIGSYKPGVPSTPLLKLSSLKLLLKWQLSEYPNQFGHFRQQTSQKVAASLCGI